MFSFFNDAFQFVLDYWFEFHEQLILYTLISLQRMKWNPEISVLFGWVLLFLRFGFAFYLKNPIYFCLIFRVGDSFLLIVFVLNELWLIHKRVHCLIAHWIHGSPPLSCLTTNFMRNNKTNPICNLGWVKFHSKKWINVVFVTI